MKHLKKFEKWEPEMYPNFTKDLTELKMSENELFCPYCGMEQGGYHPRDILDGQDVATYKCEECGETFEIEFIHYLVTRK